MTPLLVALLLPAADPPGPTVRLSDPKPGVVPAVEVSGLLKSQAEWLAARKPDDKAWGEVLRVVVAGGTDTARRPPLLGAYRLDGTTLRFEPRFPLAPGVSYRATFDPNPIPGHPDGILRTTTATLTVPKPKAVPTTVTAVYPSADTLPENTLRLYFHFSAPMSKGDVYRHLRLVNDTDKADVTLPFLELDEELWTADRTRFTLLFDPGRVKRGLKPREEDGPVLEEGKRYTLVVSGDWPDAVGNPLKAGFRKSFVAGKPDDEPVDPAKWQVVPPAAGTDGPVAVRFPKPLDHALVPRLVRVADAAGTSVPGEWAVGPNERSAAFRPTGRWAAGRYQLVTDTRLEDPCGNRVGEPFEVDVFKPVQAAIRPQFVATPFAVK